MSRGWSLSLPLAVPAALLAVVLCAGPLAAQTAAPAPAATAPSSAAPTSAAPPPAPPSSPPAAAAPAPNPVDVQRAQDRCAPGSDCANAHREPSPKPAAAAPAPAAEPGQPLVGFGSPALAAPGGLASAADAPSHPITLSAYFILGGQWLQQNTASRLVGQNNGFSMADARLEITGRPSDKFWLYLSFDGAVEQVSAADPTKGSRTVALKDAYGVFSPGALFANDSGFGGFVNAITRHLRLQAGQFKAPQDVEGLIEETEVKFPSRSIVTSGVHAPAGYEAEGLSLGRQVGVALGTDAVPLPFGTVAAQVALTNGNGPNQLFNDTTAQSVSGRLALGVLGYASLGVDGYYSPRATGTPADRQYDDLYGVGADLRVEAGPVNLMALVQSRTTRHVTLLAADEATLGYSIEGAVLLFGFLEPAVRYSLLDPSDKVPQNKVQELTAALNLYSSGAVGQGVARLSLAYTHRTEEAAHQLPNDSFDLAAQLRF